MHALIGAYSKEGQEWVDELRQVLTENLHYGCDFFNQYAPEIHFARPEGTYMLFLDCTDWCEKYGKTLDELRPPLLPCSGGYGAIKAICIFIRFTSESCYQTVR